MASTHPRSVSSPLPSRTLLAGLPAPVRRHLLARCEQVELALGTVLCDAGDRIRYVYFPIDSFISLITPAADGVVALEVGLVGDEGMLGTSLLLGVKDSPLRGLVQGAGGAWR